MDLHLGDVVHLDVFIFLVTREFVYVDFVLYRFYEASNLLGGVF